MPNSEDCSKCLKYDPDFQEEFDSIINDSNVPESDANIIPDVFDNTYLNMELVIPRDGERPDFDKVAKRLRNKDWLPIFRSHNSPILGTRMYKLEYKDGHKALLAANAIAENMFSQVDGEGNMHVLFQDIFDHRYDGTEPEQTIAERRQRGLNPLSNRRTGAQHG